MTDETRRIVEREGNSKLNNIGWSTSSAGVIHDDESGNVSPRSKKLNPSATGWPQSTADSFSKPKHFDSTDSTLTTSGGEANTGSFDAPLSLSWLHEIRKVIREEVAEGFQRLVSATESPVSSTTGSVLSPPTPSLDSPPPFPVLSQGEVVTAITVSQRPGVRFSDRRTFAKRPAGVPRSASSSQPPAEWGDLFDTDGFATPRLGQVLRGLAKYIIDECTPKNSLVITPEKLASFYLSYRLDAEILPFLDIFTSNAHDANDSLVDFYIDLEVQHHLVQKDVHSRPKVPALTPLGFAQFLTICILAYPDQEFRRLEKISTEIPLTTDTILPDGHAEKLPRTIIRSCLPAKHDVKNRKLLDGAVEDLVYDLSLSPSRSGSSSSALTASGKGVGATTARTGPDRARGMQLPDDYELKGCRKRFMPGALQTIGDESVGEGYESMHGGGGHHHQVHGTDATPLREGGAMLHNMEHVASNPTYNQPDGRVQRLSLAANTGRSHSFGHPSYFQPMTPSRTISPPPVGHRASMSSTGSSASQRPRSPQMRGYSASVPDVSTSSASSSTLICTPSSFSSASVSPTMEHGMLGTMVLRSDSGDHGAATGGRDHYRQEEQQRQLVLAEVPEAHRANSGAGGNGGVMKPHPERNLERSTSHRHRRHTHSSEGRAATATADEMGLTWGEFLNPQKASQKGDRGGNGSGYRGSY
ncbi:hypothetical protein JX265_005027 [Neoarthrinium moseri]|uniref:DUF7514 domain-containing protein n=1 Tax=Neoarthrinium moseri TaxID=1658444 RepID=A0A9P9WP07_9PEZI|nr:hypothetical protein JX265_005027 [Neoarthrinium moseri]